MTLAKSGTTSSDLSPCSFKKVLWKEEASAKMVQARDGERISISPAQREPDRLQEENTLLSVN